MMEKRGGEKTLVKPVVKLQQTRSIVDFFHFNYLVQTFWHRFKFKFESTAKSNRYRLNLIR